MNWKIKISEHFRAKVEFLKEKIARTKQSRYPSGISTSSQNYRRKKGENNYCPGWSRWRNN